MGIKKQASTPRLTGVKQKKMKGENFYRDKVKLRQWKMLRSGAPQRDSKGNITKEAVYAKTTPDSQVARIEPSRRWFGNAKTIRQDHLDKLREELTKKTNDPYQVLLKINKLPMSLLTSHEKAAKMNLLEVESYADTFGKNSSRRKPKLSFENLESFALSAENASSTYSNTSTTPLLASEKDSNAVVSNDQEQPSTDNQVDLSCLTADPIYKKGQSKRIWSELYKVIDSSDVVIHVLDARDPLGTRCTRIEQFIKEDAKHKHLVFLLNKCDLVPTNVVSNWVRVLSKEYPTIAYRASLTKPFGKAALINLLRQYSKLHPERKQISVGFVGYPNTGKSSIINSLRRKQVCSVAPIPGHTKVWQYVTLMRKIYLIDCPGVVPQVHHDGNETDLVLKGAIRIENIEGADDHIPKLLEYVKPEHLCRTYGIEPGWADSEDFLTRVARHHGRLLKGGEPDLCTVAKMILHDFIRGQLPHFTAPNPSNQKETE
jgi:nuclear GTP-binding protein